MRHKQVFILILALSGSLFWGRLFLQADSPTNVSPIPVKVVVVTTFELGNDSGDLPGEFQFWYERAHLTHRFDQPVAYHPYYMNDDGVLVIVTGECTARAAASIMLLGMDPRFDLTHAYWLLAGIAGGNPARTSLSVAPLGRNGL